MKKTLALLFLLPFLPATNLPQRNPHRSLAYNIRSIIRDATFLSHGMLPPSPLANIYIAQTALGAGTGVDAADALAYTYFNNASNCSSSGPIGPGTTVWIVGTISPGAGVNALTFQCGGSAGNLVTLKFSPGASITAPYWACSSSGVVCLSGEIVDEQSYTMVDGNNLQGTITATANGTNLANQQPGAGVVMSNCTNCTTQNLNINNGYVHACTWSTGGTPLVNCTDSSTAASNSFGIIAAPTSTPQNNISALGNNIHDVRWGIYFAMIAGATTTNYTISGNTTYDVDHGIFVADNNSNAILNRLVIDKNTCHDMQNWDESNDAFHHDCVHIATDSTGSKINSPQISNSYDYSGSTGQGLHANTFIYVAGGGAGDTGGSGITNAGVFNNVLWSTFTGTVGSATCQAIFGTAAIAAYGLNGQFFNNTFLGVTTAACGQGNICIQYLGTGTVQQNNICQDWSLFTFNDGGSTMSFSNYNVVYATGSTPFHAGSTYYNLANWNLCTSGCQTSTGAPDLNSSISSPGPLLNASSTPPYQLTNSTSTAWGKGANFTSSYCVTWPEACTDANGTARPSTGNWDMGAYQSSGGGGGSMTVSPGSLSFGTVTQFTSSPSQTVTVTNGSSTIATAMNNTTFTGPNNTDFSVVTGGTCTSALAVGANCTYFIVFTPTAAAGTRESATLNVNFAGPSGSPLLVTLTGTSGTGPAVTFSPVGTLAFGLQGVNTTSPSGVITVTSAGTTNLVLAAANAVTMSGTNSPDFSIIATTCTNGLSLTPTSSCTITITFTPSAAGPRIAQINLSDNVTGSPQVELLTGTGGSTAPATTMFSLQWNAVPLPAAPPIPVLASYAPKNSYVTASGFSQDGKTFAASMTLTVTGTNFEPGPTATFDGKAVTATYVSPTQVTVSVPLTMVSLLPTTAPMSHTIVVTVPNAQAVIPPVN